MTIKPSDYRTIEKYTGRKIKFIPNLKDKINQSAYTTNKILEGFEMSIENEKYKSGQYETWRENYMLDNLFSDDVSIYDRSMCEYGFPNSVLDCWIVNSAQIANSAILKVMEPKS